jgi:hypothetical protein
MRLNQKNWGDPKKIQARQDTILTPYRNFYHRHGIPKNRQYWTMCGQCASAKGELIKGCELDQMVREKLIVPNQFHGSEIVLEIHEVNSMVPEAYWHNKDFYQAMVEASNRDDFNPAVVNIDTISMTKEGALQIAKIMSFLSKLNIRRVMVIANIILQIRSHFSSNQKTMDFLKELLPFQFAMSNGGWHIYDRGYVYSGTGGNNTTMGTIIFYRK